MQNRRHGFTLMELVVVLAIAVILTVIGAISLSSRIKTSRLESAAQTLASDLSYARTAALFKGCPTRFILCMDKKCETTNVASNQGAGNFIGSGGAPARYYAILRLSRQTNPLLSCYNENAVNAITATGGDGFDNWDFDRRPQIIPDGVAFTSIYGAAPSFVLDYSDWSSTSDDAASNSLWFSPNIGSFTNPVDTGIETMANGDTAIFQLSIDDCDPANDGDCAAMVVTMSSGGEVSVVSCSPGSRTNNTDFCFD